MLKKGLFFVFCLFLGCLFLCVKTLLAQSNMYSLNLGTSLEYNDNIYLTDSGKEDDLLSNFDLNFLANRATKISDLSFRYSLSRVFYWERSGNDAFRHNLALGYTRYFEKKWLLALDANYYRTEEAIEPSEDVFRERRESREPYYRLNSSCTISYEYSEGSFVKAGLKINYLQNEDPYTEDSRIYTEFISVSKDFTWWFTSFTINFVQREFETEKPVNTWGVNWSIGHKLAHNKNISFNVSAERTQNIGYNEDDYWSYNAAINYRWQPERDQEYHFSFGYYLRDNDNSGKEDEGYTFSVSYAKNFRLSSVTIRGSGGYRYQYAEAQNTGFTEYYLLNLGYNRELSKTLSFSASMFYRTEDFKDRDGEEDTYGLSFSLNKKLTKRLLCSLSYSYREADSDLPSNDYKVNVIVVTLEYLLWQAKEFALPRLWRF